MPLLKPYLLTLVLLRVALCYTNFEKLPSPILLSNEELKLDLLDYFNGENISFTSNYPIPPKIQISNPTNFSNNENILSFTIFRDYLMNWNLPSVFAVLTQSNEVYYANATSSQSVPHFKDLFNITLPNAECYSIAAMNSTTLVADCQTLTADYLFFINSETKEMRHYAAPNLGQVESRELFINNYNQGGVQNIICFRYTDNCENNCYIQTMNITNPDNVEQINLIYASNLNLEGFPLIDLIVYANFIFALDANANLYQIRWQGKFPSIITSFKLYSNSTTEKFLAFDFQEHQVTITGYVYLYFLTNTTLYRYVYTVSNQELTLLNSKQLKSSDTVGLQTGLISATKDFVIAQLEYKNGTQLIITYPNSVPNIFSSYFSRNTFQNLSLLKTASKSQNTIWIFDNSEGTSLVYSSPYFTIKQYVPGNYEASFEVKDVFQTNYSSLSFTVIGNSDTSILATQSNSNFSIVGGSNLQIEADELFSGPFLNVQGGVPTLGIVPFISTMGLSLKSSYLVNTSLTASPYVIVSQDSINDLHLEYCTLNDQALQCEDQLNISKKLSKAISTIEFGPNFFAYQFDNKETNFYGYTGTNYEPYQNVCDSFAIVTDVGEPFFICAANNELNLEWMGNGTPQLYSWNASSNIVDVQTSTIYPLLIFLQTNDSISILHVENFINNMNPVISSFQIEEKYTLYITGSSIILANLNSILEYSLSDIYNPFIVKQYGDLMNYEDPSSVETKLTGGLGYFYLAGQISNQGEYTYIDVLRAGQQGQSSWINFEQACLSNSETITSISSAYVSDSQEIVYVFCGSGGKKARAPFIVNTEIQYTYSSTQGLGSLNLMNMENLTLMGNDLLTNTSTSINLTVQVINNQLKIELNNEELQVNGSAAQNLTTTFNQNEYFTGVVYDYQLTPENFADLYNFEIFNAITENQFSFSLGSPLIDGCFIETSENMYLLTEKNLTVINKKRIIGNWQLLDYQGQQLSCTRVLVTSNEETFFLGCYDNLESGLFIYTLSFSGILSPIVQIYANTLLQLKILNSETLLILTDFNQIYITDEFGNSNLVNADSLYTHNPKFVDIERYCYTNLDKHYVCFIALLDANSEVWGFDLDLTTNQTTNFTNFNLETFEPFIVLGLSKSVSWQGIAIYDFNTSNREAIFMISAQNFMTVLMQIDFNSESATVLQIFSSYLDYQPVGSIVLNVKKSLCAYAAYSNNEESYNVIIYPTLNFTDNNSESFNQSEIQVIGPVGWEPLQITNIYTKPYILSNDFLTTSSGNTLVQYEAGPNPTLRFNFEDISSNYITVTASNQYSENFFRIQLLLPHPGPGPHNVPIPVIPNDNWIFIVSGIVLLLLAIGGGIYWYRKKKINTPLTADDYLSESSFYKNANNPDIEF